MGVVRGQVIGVLYSERCDEDIWETGRPEDTFLWCWRYGAPPFEDSGLTSPPLMREMTIGEATANAEDAMEEIYELLGGVEPSRDPATRPRPWW
jgi:hypothetical protein